MGLSDSIKELVTFFTNNPAPLLLALVLWFAKELWSDVKDLKKTRADYASKASLSALGDSLKALLEEELDFVRDRELLPFKQQVMLDGQSLSERESEARKVMQDRLLSEVNNLNHRLQMLQEQMNNMNKGLRHEIYLQEERNVRAAEALKVNLTQYVEVLTARFGKAVKLRLASRTLPGAEDTLDETEDTPD